MILQNYLPVVYSNAPLDKNDKLEDSLVSKEHTVIDLGEDEFTVGRLHPMMDNDLRIRRLEKEAADPEVAVILLDVVLGYGAHPDPASELAPAIATAIKTAHKPGGTWRWWRSSAARMEILRGWKIKSRCSKMRAPGVETSNDKAARYVGRLLQAIERSADAC